MSPTRFPALMTRGSSAKSEERRGGEEGRFRGWPDPLKKKFEWRGLNERMAVLIFRPCTLCRHFPQAAWTGNLVIGYSHAAATIAWHRRGDQARDVRSNAA